MPPWQQTLQQRLVDALEAGRLGHGLLLTGPEAMGMDAVAQALAARLLCTAPEAGAACGRCRGCGLRLAGSHPDLRQLGLEFNDKTKKQRTEILIEQVRVLGEWFALTSQLGGAQVAIIDPADLLNRNAANALLKTLEEPSGNRYLILISARPHALPATVRSRCQRFELHLPEPSQAQAWLERSGVHAAAQALAAARGNPGLAAAWAEAGTLELARAVEAELEAIATGRSEVLDTAKAWAGDDLLGLRLMLAAEHAARLCARAQGLEDDARLTAPMDFQKLSAWFDAANRLRGLVGSPIRSDLAVAGLLRDWRQACTGAR